jgi:hypothetical protein
VVTGDSGGTPWGGRELPPSPYADDTGEPDARLAAALSELAASLDRSASPGQSAQVESEVVAALAAARLFVAVVAVTDEHAHMALITVTNPDGRRSLPVFSTPASLARWRPDARPVPAPGQRAALSAVAEGCDLLDLDPSGPVPYQVRRPAVWALGRGLSWTPSYANPVLVQEVSLICAEEGLASRVEAGSSAELRVVLTLPRGLDEQQVSAVTARLSRRLAASEQVADGVDSMELKLATG